MTEDDKSDDIDASDWGVSVSNNPDLGPVETVRTVGRRLWERRDELLSGSQSRR